MNKKELSGLRKLAIVAEKLDERGFYSFADRIDEVIQKKADYGNWRGKEEVAAAIEKLRGLMIEHGDTIKPDLKKLLGVALSIAKSELMEAEPGMGGFSDQPLNMNEWEPIDLPVAEASKK